MEGNFQVSLWGFTEYCENHQAGRQASSDICVRPGQEYKWRSLGPCFPTPGSILHHKGLHIHEQRHLSNHVEAQSIPPSPFTYPLPILPAQGRILAARPALSWDRTLGWVLGVYWAISFLFFSFLNWANSTGVSKGQLHFWWTMFKSTK